MTDLGRNEQATVRKLFVNNLIGYELSALKVAGNLMIDLQHDLLRFVR